MSLYLIGSALVFFCLSWRKYQEDRLSFMLLHGGRLPQSNGPATGGSAPHGAAAARSLAATPSPAGVHMLLLSIFDGHGGAETSHYCHKYFHPFLRARIEAQWHRWMDERREWAAERDANTAAAAAAVAAATADTSVAAAAPAPRRKRTGSFTESGEPQSAAASAPSRSRSHSASHGSSAAFTAPPPPPAYPFDAAFLTAAFLDFDAYIPLPSPDNIPRNQPPQPQQQTLGGMRRQTQPQAPPEGNNIPHLASGTTATLCIVDLANQ